MNIRAEILGGAEERKTRLLVRKKPKQVEATGLTDIVIPREEVRRTDMRREDRPPADGKIYRARFRDCDHEVELLNLSGGGAMIRGRLSPNIDEPLELFLSEGESIECLVRWVRDMRIGLELAHETKVQCTEEKRVELLREVVRERFPAEELEMVKLESKETDHRRADRHPLIWFGELHHNSHRWTVRLRNISETGALIEFTGALRLGSEVELDLGASGKLAATVSWAVGDHAGLEFAEPFDLAQLAKSKPRVTSTTWLRPAYLEGETAEDSAWDDAWNRLSVDELRFELEGYLKR
ncbi:MAG TPA: PilZ domain-containing protein [Sphingomicrobium sp.]|nr:PilZ domain-containing protein [Sphingomicrobium sp.]